MTPLDDIQVIHGPGNYEVINDRSPFRMMVLGLLEDHREIVGVHGNVISGHARYSGLVASLFIRLDNSDWKRDNTSHAQFKVGPTPARLNGKYPFFNPDGSDVDGYPVIVRFASIDARGDGESVIDSAEETFRKSQAEHTGNR